MRKAQTRNLPVFGMIECRDSGAPICDAMYFKGDAIGSPRNQLVAIIARVNNVKILEETVFVDYNGKLVRSEEGGEVQFNIRSLHFGAFVSFGSADNKCVNSRGLPKITPVWVLKPGNIVFDAEARVRLAFANYAGNPEKLGVYCVSDNGNVSYNGETLEYGIYFCNSTGGK